MSPERLQEVEKLYHAARELEPGQRSALLAGACSGDEELRREVESLLAQDPAREGLLDRPAAGLLEEAPVPALTAGALLGPYQIEAPIGAGGMGEVYRAIDTRLGRAVAIKTMQRKFSDRFDREARTISSLNHPNICTLYDVGPNYLVMELVEGETLAAKLKRGKLSIGDTLLYGGQIAAALAEAHSKGITHRDLKPRNIMVTKSGVKVLDFGLAKTQRDESLTASHAIMGTPAYMAPEQLEGKDCDARTDIYALGLVLREMTIGRRNGATTGLPQHLAHVIDRCLAKEPEDRWQTARDLKAELEWAPPDAERVISASRHSRVPWVVAAALAVGLLGVSLVAWRATRPLERPLMRFSVDLGPDAVEGPFITAAISPDGTRLAFLARGPGGKQQLATRLLDQAQATQLAGTENAADPFFSPDGQWIGFFADGKMKKISVQGGAAVTLCDAPFARGASWGEDGSIIVSLIAYYGLSRVLATGGAPQTLTKPGKGEGSHVWPQILPGAHAALFTSGANTGAYEEGSIAVLSLNSGQWKTVQSGG
jgi:predicted Ser/Thr protein kinase